MGQVVVSYNQLTYFKKLQLTSHFVLKLSWLNAAENYTNFVQISLRINEGLVSGIKRHSSIILRLQKTKTNSFWSTDFHESCLECKKDVTINDFLPFNE